MSLAVCVSWARDAYYLNFVPAENSALTAAAREAGVTLAPLDIKKEIPPDALFIFSAKGDYSNTVDTLTERVEKHVRLGGGLVIFAAQANYQMMRLAFMLPTTGFMASDRLGRRGAARVAFAAKGFEAVKGLAAESYYEIRPYHVTERGQEKHFIYERPAPYIRYGAGAADAPEKLLPTQTWYWTRSIQNRDWTTLLALDDFQSMPLVISGRYGAGRTIASGANLAGLEDSAEARALWNALFKTTLAAPSEPRRVAADIAASSYDAAKRSLKLIITSDEAQTAEVVLRLLTSEYTFSDESHKEVKLKKGETTVEFPIARPTEFSPAETRENDRYLARVGLLTDGGATLAAERAIPFNAASTLSLALDSDEARLTEDFYPTTGFTRFPLADRYGFQNSTYAYRPGDTVHLTATLRNGIDNLAPLAQVIDLNHPTNLAVIALSDNGISRSAAADWYAKNGYPVFSFDTKETARVQWTFPDDVTLESIEIMSGTGTFRNFGNDAPEAVRIFAGDTRVYENLAAKIAFAPTNGNGKLDCVFETPHRARVWVAEFPGDPKRSGMRHIGEVWLWGRASAQPPAQTGSLELRAVNVMTGKTMPILREKLTLQATRRVTAEFTLPESDRAEFYRIDASFETAQASRPILAVRPHAPLTHAFSSMDVNPDVVSQGFIVSRGFRTALPFAAGNDTPPSAWGSPDDLIWAYAYGFKEEGGRETKRAPGLLFVSNDDFRHYITPWRPFANGEEFYKIARPFLLDSFKKHPRWAKASIVEFGNSDRWDTGPSIGINQGWQDIVAFDDYLRGKGLPPLIGQTRPKLVDDILKNHIVEWREWHLDRYIANLRMFKETFEKEGKKFELSSQGGPVIPVEKGNEVAAVARGSSNDSTWGMDMESPSRTTGRQLGMLALSPELTFRAVAIWGYVSAILNNPQWHGVTATTEATRRRFLGDFFKGRIHSDGRYTSIHDVAYSVNARTSNRVTEKDYQHFLQMLTQGALLTPEAPLGAGLVVANDFFNDPKNLRFTFFDDMDEIRRLSALHAILIDNGFPVSFCARLDGIAHWNGTAPILIVNPERLTPKELAILEKLEKQGCKMIACGSVGTPPHETPALPADVAAFFAANPETRKLIMLETPALPTSIASETVKLLQDFAKPKLAFEKGFTGYGFISNGRQFIEVEDWREEPRAGAVFLRSAAASLKAIDLNSHRPLKTRRRTDGFEITFPTASGDARLIAFEEVP
ncbi:MAG: hypothetical protein LBW77_04470 [Verrucomicrobiota bacterium]|nr:hypothetical protein [Verrucomicrobiota bacterium]